MVKKKINFRWLTYSHPAFKRSWTRCLKIINKSVKIVFFNAIYWLWLSLSFSETFFKWLLVTSVRCNYSSYVRSTQKIEINNDKYRMDESTEKCDISVCWGFRSITSNSGPTQPWQKKTKFFFSLDFPCTHAHTHTLSASQRISLLCAL